MNTTLYVENIRIDQGPVLIDSNILIAESGIHDLPAGSYALPKFFVSLIHKHLLHGIVADSPAIPFLDPADHLTFFL
ncbi:MAG TPA: hypothetical protein VK644_08815, partial [Chitinophagaceae bacterium]|nr:hypothetical protein [Chitinophagaceae bacterium]